MEDEAWGFHANGSGTLAMLRLGDFHSFAFKWYLKSNHKLSFAQPKQNSFRGGCLFFFEGVGVFKVTDEINEYGEEREILTIQSKKGEFRLTKKADDFLEKYMERIKAFQSPSEKIVKSTKRDIARIVRRKR